jgi:hypothetical protein
VLKQLFNKASEKAGGQAELGEWLGIPQSRVSEFKNYKGKGRKPSDIMIGELAEYVGLDPVETIIKCKRETDRENMMIWDKWCARRESNPRPSASEVVSRLVINLYQIILSNLQHRHTEHNLNARIS